MPRSTYYYYVKKEKNPDKYKEIKEEISNIFNANQGRYGYRRITLELRNRGFLINHKTVQRLMKQLNLKCMVRIKKYKSYKGEIGKIAPNLLNRDFNAEKPNQKWTTDITEFSLFGEKTYLSPILDMHSNEIIAYDLSLSPNMNQIKRMLNKAFDKFSKVDGLIFHSDQGWQYQHRVFRTALSEHGIIQSMSRKGNCYDNCIMETFFGRLKNEMYYGCEKDYESFETFSHAVEEYIDYYNNERIQAKTKWMPPVKYREASMCCCA